jgi:hypothetical protein
MSLCGLDTDPALGNEPCKTERESWLCGKRESLDYEEMR